MRVAKAVVQEVSTQADIVVRPVSADDRPVASPVHQMQRSLNRSVARAQVRRIQPDIAAMRIGLFVIAPALMWAGIIRFAMTF
jgi:hypothetical protein